MSEGFQENTRQLIRDFFDSYDLPGVRVLLWNWLKAALGQDTLSARERRDLMTFYEDLLRLVEAVGKDF